MQKRKRHFAVAGKTASADQWAALMMIGEFAAETRLRYFSPHACRD